MNRPSVTFLNSQLSDFGIKMNILWLTLHVYSQGMLASVQYDTSKYAPKWRKLLTFQGF